MNYETRYRTSLGGRVMHRKWGFRGWTEKHFSVFKSLLECYSDLEFRKPKSMLQRLAGVPAAQAPLSWGCPGSKRWPSALVQQEEPVGFEKGTATPLACPSLVTNSLGWVGQGSPTATDRGGIPQGQMIQPEWRACSATWVLVQASPRVCRETSLGHRFLRGLSSFICKIKGRTITS